MFYKLNIDGDIHRTEVTSIENRQTSNKEHLNLKNLEGHRAHVPDYSGGDGVFGVGLGAAQRRQDDGGPQVVRTHPHLGHLQLALGDGASLVEHDGPHLVGVLQGLRALDENAVDGAHTWKVSFG